MYCWSCGLELERSERVCSRCGTARAGAPEAAPVPARVPRTHHPPAQLRSCPACGFRGEGIPYFRRAGNLALLTLAALFTYLVGGAVYWLIKRGDQVCPSCGLNWERSRPLGGTDHDERSHDPSPPRVPAETPARVTPAPAHEKGLPRSGVLRRITGMLMGLPSLFFLGVAIIEWHPVPALIGGLMGVTGAAIFGWGYTSLQARREALLQRLQRRVLLLARERDGRLTATEVAAELDVTIPAAERVLLSLDDGFRVRSDVSDEGLLYFEFPEILLGGSGGSNGLITGP